MTTTPRPAWNYDSRHHTPVQSAAARNRKYEPSAHGFGSMFEQAQANSAWQSNLRPEFHAAQPGVWNGTSHSSPTGNYKSGVSLVSRGAGALSRAMRPGGGARTPPTPPSPGTGTPPTGNGH